MKLLLAIECDPELEFPFSTVGELLSKIVAQIDVGATAGKLNSKGVTITYQVDDD